MNAVRHLNVANLGNELVAHSWTAENLSSGFKPNELHVSASTSCSFLRHAGQTEMRSFCSGANEKALKFDCHVLSGNTVNIPGPTNTQRTSMANQNKL